MSTLRVNTLQDAAGTGQSAMAGAAKAWVNFNGTGTVAIRASYNVTSITDNGVGDYTVNFTTAMPDANYSSQVLSQGTDHAVWDTGMVFSAGSYRYKLVNAAGAATSDHAKQCVAIFC